MLTLPPPAEQWKFSHTQCRVKMADKRIQSPISWLVIYIGLRGELGNFINGTCSVYIRKYKNNLGTHSKNGFLSYLLRLLHTLSYDRSYFPRLIYLIHLEECVCKIREKNRTVILKMCMRMNKWKHPYTERHLLNSHIHFSSILSVQNGNTDSALSSQHLRTELTTSKNHALLKIWCIIDGRWP
jgi:hypothetical protein